jgi:hypothetical protein
MSSFIDARGFSRYMGATTCDVGGAGVGGAAVMHCTAPERIDELCLPAGAETRRASALTRQRPFQLPSMFWGYPGSTESLRTSYR